MLTFIYFLTADPTETLFKNLTHTSKRTRLVNALNRVDQKLLTITFKNILNKDLCDHFRSSVHDPLLKNPAYQKQVVIPLYIGLRSSPVPNVNLLSSCAVMDVLQHRFERFSLIFS